MKAALTRCAAALRLRPYLITLVFIAVFVAAMWVSNREEPYDLSLVPPEVLAALREKPCGPEPKFATLRMTLRREYRDNGVPIEITIERVERHLGHAIVARTERWFDRNRTTPAREQRTLTACGFLGLDYRFRVPLPIFGSLLKEVGWSRDRLRSIRIDEARDFPARAGGVYAYVKTTRYDDVNADTGYRESTTRPTRYVVVERSDAQKLHPKLRGDAHHVTCTTQYELTTSGGFDQHKEQTKTVKRTSVYYFVEQLGWQFQVRDAEDDDYRTYTTVVDVASE